MSKENFKTIVMIDCGRGFYSVNSILAILDQMAEYGYQNLMLGFGNDGFRFLLDDMSVTVDGITYSGTVIEDAIRKKNSELAPDAAGEWYESDMNRILAYAKERSVTISPMIDTPGHATAITAAMTACGINAAVANRNGSTDTGSTTFDVANLQAVSFAEAFIQKYIHYFADKGCVYFNLGMDEYAGNNGGYSSMSDEEKTALCSYLSELCERVSAAGMVPAAFCDVIGNFHSAGESPSSTDRDRNDIPDCLTGINWQGQGLDGHPNLNANQNWYYVLGAEGDGWAGYQRAMRCTESVGAAVPVNGIADAGSILAIWNDNYLNEEKYIDAVKNIIANQAIHNEDYFKSAWSNIHAKHVF